MAPVICLVTRLEAIDDVLDVVKVWSPRVLSVTVGEPRNHASHEY